MKKANQDIREVLKKHKIAQWELADKMKFSPNYFVVKMRHEFDSQEKLRAFDCIQEILEERGE